MSKGLQNAFRNWWHGKVNDRLNESGSPKCSWRESREELQEKRVALKAWLAACEYLSKEIDALSEQNYFMHNQLLKTDDHPTCSTCEHYDQGTCCEIGEYGRHTVKADFYCAGHEEKEVGE
jgi:hypothetical protein